MIASSFADGMNSWQITFVIALNIVAFAGWMTALWLWTERPRRTPPVREVVASYPRFASGGMVHATPPRYAGHRRTAQQAKDVRIRRYV